MYEYSKISKDTSSEVRFLPSEAMKFDGVFLEDEIEGYRTLSVSGRELIAYEVSDNPISGGDGSRFIGAHLPNRTITVQYSLDSDSPEELRSKFNKMNQLLSKKQAVLSFNDEPDHEFIGTFAGSGGVPEGRLNVIGTFDIVCSDPYKYNKVQTITGAGSITINIPLAESVVVDSFKIEPSTYTDVFEITNITKGLKLRLINASESVQPITLRPRTQEIIRSGIDRPQLLDWKSDFENFEVETEDEIKVTPSTATLTINIRERLR